MKKKHLLILLPLLIIVGTIFFALLTKDPFINDFKYWNITYPSEVSLYEYREDKGFTGDGTSYIVFENNTNHRNELQEYLKNSNTLTLNYEEALNRISFLDDNRLYHEYFKESLNASMHLVDDGNLNYLILIQTDAHIIYVFITI